LISFGSYGLTLATIGGQSRMNNFRDIAENGFTRHRTKKNKTKNTTEEKGTNNRDTTKKAAWIRWSSMVSNSCLV